MTKLRKYLKNPYALFVYLGNRGWLNWIPDRPYLKLVYRGQTGTRLNLQTPVTFNEKLQWLKLHDRDPRYTDLVDKYRVKEFVSGVLGPSAVVPTIGVWEDASQIDFSKLPNEFVLKTNHNSGGVIICRDKRFFDAKRAVVSLNAQLKRSYFWPTREWPYLGVRPVVFAEKYLSDDRTFTGDGDVRNGRPPGADSELRGLLDYKFYCFHGVPQFLYVSQGLEDHSTARVAFLTLEWTALGFGRSDYVAFEHLPPKPDKLGDMIEAAKMLAADIPFVRVDLFNHHGTVLFSEMTFHPVAGMMPFVPQDADRQTGALLDLGTVRD